MSPPLRWSHTLSLLLLLASTSACAGESAAPPQFASHGWSTVALGGLLPTSEQLLEMRDADYVLRVADGKMNQIPAQKTKLPIDPHGHVQCLALFVGPDDTIYAAQNSVLSKSTDGGKTWTHHRQ